jgi:hypothetical protein
VRRNGGQATHLSHDEEDVSLERGEIEDGDVVEDWIVRIDHWWGAKPSACHEVGCGLEIDGIGGGKVFPLPRSHSPRANLWEVF